MLKMSSSELAIVYASLILADDGVEISTDKLLALCKAAGVEVEPVWASVFAKALEGKNVKEMLQKIGSAAPSATATAGTTTAGATAAVEEKKEDKKEEEEEEDDDMGFGLFD
ncbi:ribosomal protein P1 [Calcarisporiella thermophila]|uniref:ribosomal protein P1 n=1 Tax=Calcarisporiella thermophila TaxID=911321 RepID=UPI0037431E33